MSIRKGDVTGITPAGQPNLVEGTMGISYHDGGATLPMPRWFLGNPKSGFHVGAAQYDQAIVLSWGAGDRPSAVVAMTDHPEELDVLPPGEPVIYAPNGTMLLHAKTDGSLAIVTPGGASLTTDASGNVVLDAASGKNVTVSAGAGGTLTFEGASTVQQSLDVAGITTLAGEVQQATSGATWTITAAGASTFTSTSAGSLTATTGQFSNTLTAQSGLTVSAGPITVPANSIAGAAINGNISGDAAGLTGTLPGSQVSGNIAGDAGGLAGVAVSSWTRGSYAFSITLPTGWSSLGTGLYTLNATTPSTFCCWIDVTSGTSALGVAPFAYGTSGGFLVYVLAAGAYTFTIYWDIIAH